MNYMGSKRKIARFILPIIQGCIDVTGADTYVEPFCGGCNIIDKVRCENRIASDKNKYLVAMLANPHKLLSIKKRFSKEEYDYVWHHKDEFEDWYVGAVGFLCSFGGKFFGGYADYEMNCGRDKQVEVRRGILKQAPLLKDIQFYHGDFTAHDYEGAVIYCDPPYKGQRQYRINSGKGNRFDWDAFWQWVREQSKKNIVLVSESKAPDDMEIIWQREIKYTANKDSNNLVGVERLYKYVV